MLMFTLLDAGLVLDIRLSVRFLCSGRDVFKDGFEGTHFAALVHREAACSAFLVWVGPLI